MNFLLHSWIWSDNLLAKRWSWQYNVAPCADIMCQSHFSVKRKVFFCSYICDLSEGLSSWRVLDGLNGHRDLHCFSLWSPESLKNMKYTTGVTFSQVPNSLITDKNLKRWKKNVHHYLVNCSKNPWAQCFYFLQLWRSQNASMNLGALFSRTQRLKALSDQKDFFFVFPLLKT